MFFCVVFLVLLQRRLWWYFCFLFFCGDVFVVVGCFLY